MLQLQRVGVSRLRRRDQEGERWPGSVCGGTRRSNTRACTRSPASRPSVGAGRGGKSPTRDSRYTWVLLTHLHTPAFSRESSVNPSSSNFFVRPRTVALLCVRENPLENSWRCSKEVSAGLRAPPVSNVWDLDGDVGDEKEEREKKKKERRERNRKILEDLYLICLIDLTSSLFRRLMALVASPTIKNERENLFYNESRPRGRGLIMEWTKREVLAFPYLR